MVPKSIPTTGPVCAHENISGGNSTGRARELVRTGYLRVHIPRDHRAWNIGIVAIAGDGLPERTGSGEHGDDGVSFEWERGEEDVDVDVGGEDGVREALTSDFRNFVPLRTDYVNGP